MTDKDISAIAAEVSLLMQLDRMRHHVGTEIDMAALGNVPDYIASVFQNANAVAGELTPTVAYDLINKRVSRLEAHLYLMRLELENRNMRDPARIFDDPLAISAYGERMDQMVRVEKSFGFEAPILAHGWYPVEQGPKGSFRWMRPQAPGPDGAIRPAIACVPHLGQVDQTIEIHGSVLQSEQIDGLEIKAGVAVAEILRKPETPSQFVARLGIAGKDLAAASYLPVEFHLTTFLQPSSADARMLGVNISRFLCIPGVAAAQAGEGDSASEGADGQGKDLA